MQICSDGVVLWYWPMVLWSCEQWCRRLRSDYPVVLTWTTAADTIITDHDGGDDYDGDSKKIMRVMVIVLQRKDDGDLCDDLSLAGPGIPRSVN